MKKDVINTILSLIVGGAIILLIYCWMSMKFPVVDEITTYEYGDRNEYVVWVKDPMDLFLISYGESEKSEKDAVVKAKEKYRTKILMWTGITLIVVIPSEYFRRRRIKRQKM